MEVIDYFWFISVTHLFTMMVLYNYMYHYTSNAEARICIQTGSGGFHY